MWYQDLIVLKQNVLGTFFTVFTPTREQKVRKASAWGATAYFLAGFSCGFFCYAFTFAWRNLLSNAHEEIIMLDLVAREELDVSFNDIGGLHDELEKIRDTVIQPFNIWKELPSYDKKRVRLIPQGVLLCGPSGTGKSLVAKAIAKEVNADFINIKASALLDKNVGESEKFAKALFTLARKVTPSVIFIDEIDTLLIPHSINSMLGVLLSEWDALSLCKDSSVLVIGASNRQLLIDEAFLRRMPLRFQFVVPNERDREDILRKLLKKEKIDTDVSLSSIAARTQNYTGSKLGELVRVASMQRILEVSLHTQTIDMTNLRPISLSDFEFAITGVRPNIVC